MTDKNIQKAKHCLRMIELYATSKDEKLFYIIELMRYERKETLALVNKEIDKIGLCKSCEGRGIIKRGYPGHLEEIQCRKCNGNGYFKVMRVSKILEILKSRLGELK